MLAASTAPPVLLVVVVVVVVEITSDVKSEVLVGEEVVLGVEDVPVVVWLPGCEL